MGVVAVLLAGWVARPTWARVQNPRDEAWASWFSAHPQSPEDYCIGKFRTYDYVMLGEYHGFQDPLDCMTRIIRRPDFYSQVKNVVFECLTANNQPLIDEFLSSRTYREDLIITAFRNMHFPFGWGCAAYLKPLKAIWELNQQRHAGIKIWCGSAPIYWDKISTKPQFLWADTLVQEFYPWHLIVFENLRPKALMLWGAKHCYKKLMRGEKSFEPTVAYFLANAGMGGLSVKECSILFHQDEDLDNGALERGFTCAGEHPTGFDIAGSPLARVPGSVLWKGLRSDLLMGDLADGYVVLARAAKRVRGRLIPGFYSKSYEAVAVRRAMTAYGVSKGEARSRLQKEKAFFGGS